MRRCIWCGAVVTNTPNNLCCEAWIQAIRDLRTEVRTLGLPLSASERQALQTKTPHVVTRGARQPKDS